MKVDIELVNGCWKDFLQHEFSLDYMKDLEDFLKSELVEGKTIYPPLDEVYTAFSLTPLEEVKCCIIGQDPYFLAGLAHGLAFSVKDGVSPPRSLMNIYKELESDLGLIKPTGGNLTQWAKNGVFLLNTLLTVEANKAGSHKRKGWEKLTIKVIQELNKKKEHVVFLAWGKDAHKVCQHVDLTKHYVIQTSHPSPLGARKVGKDFDAFLGSHCFSQANKWLKSKGVESIDWSLL